MFEKAPIAKTDHGKHHSLLFAASSRRPEKPIVSIDFHVTERVDQKKPVVSAPPPAPVLTHDPHQRPRPPAKTMSPADDSLAQMLTLSGPSQRPHPLSRGGSVYTPGTVTVNVSSFPLLIIVIRKLSTN